jgi:crotonobetainyl-CoA:carnitine CoA-transferase CaiB-like acyl-CoA transferase
VSALEGIRVLDFTQIIAGPFCTMLLADLGADVVKVETPGRGDLGRLMAPTMPGGDSGAFVAVNRNTRSVAVDLKHPRAGEVIHVLAARADVVIENFRPGVAARLGVDYESLRDVSDDLIYCSVSGFGDSGPDAGLGGLDLIAQGLTGLMSVTGEPGGGPVKCGIPVTDLGAALFATYGILAALVARDRGGGGQRVTTSLFEAGMALSIWEATEFFHTGNVPRRLGSAHRLSAPYQAFETSDGHVNVGADNPHHWQRFCELLGLEDLRDDPRFETNAARLANLSALVQLVEDVTRLEPSDHWLQLLRAEGIPAGRIATVPEALASAQAAAREMVLEVPAPGGSRTRALGPAVKFSGTPADAARRAAPRLGEHTAEVLREAGVDEATMAEYQAEGVVA